MLEKMNPGVRLEMCMGFLSMFMLAMVAWSGFELRQAYVSDGFTRVPSVSLAAAETPYVRENRTGFSRLSSQVTAR